MFTSSLARRTIAAARPIGGDMGSQSQILVVDDEGDLREMVASYLARADILVLPNPASAISSHATSPLKLFEYMAAGKAIVASNLPAIAEVLQDDRNAVLVAAGDAAALAAAIRRLNDDAGLRTRLGESARRDVAEYSWSRRAERLEALFNEVLAAAR